MNSGFVREFLRRRDAGDVITNTVSTASHPPPSKALGGLPKPEGGLEFLIESKASAKEVHKFFKEQVARYNDSQPALRAEIKRRWKGDPVPS